MEKRRNEGVGLVPGLPPGWQREEIIRKSGLSAGRTDVYYFSPDGRKCRSKPQLARALGNRVDLSGFDFKAGKLLHSSMRKRMRHDANLALPIRQTASIFKQPVSVIRNRPESKTRSDLKHGPQEQPKQLFWEKRLRGVVACDSAEECFKALDLPNNIQGAGPELSTQNLLQSIAAALHLSGQPVTGQPATKSVIHKNPGVHINANQPHIEVVVISDDDIRKQEQKVQDARKKLEQIMNNSCHMVP